MARGTRGQTDKKGEYVERREISDEVGNRPDTIRVIPYQRLISGLSEQQGALYHSAIFPNPNIFEPKGSAADMPGGYAGATMRLLAGKGVIDERVIRGASPEIREQLSLHLQH